VKVFNDAIVISANTVGTRLGQPTIGTAMCLFYSDHKDPYEHTTRACIDT